MDAGTGNLPQVKVAWLQGGESSLRVEVVKFWFGGKFSVIRVDLGPPGDVGKSALGQVLRTESSAVRSWQSVSVMTEQQGNNPTATQKNDRYESKVQ